MAEVGEVLERRTKQRDGRDRIRLTGVHGTGWVAVSLDGFSPPFHVSAGELVSEYGVTDPALPPSEAAILLKRDNATTAADNRAYGRLHGRQTAPPPVEPHPDSPEGQFRAAEVEEAE